MKKLVVIFCCKSFKLFYMDPYCDLRYKSALHIYGSALFFIRKHLFVQDS